MTNSIITFLASFLIWFMFTGVVYFWVVNKKLSTKEVLYGIAASFLAWGISEIIKEMFPTTRPFINENLRPLTFTVPLDGAFPSTHAAVSFGLASGVWKYNKKLGTVYLFAAMLVSLGRVMSNVHYFIDVIGGAYLGVVSAYLVNKFHSSTI